MTKMIYKILQKKRMIYTYIYVEGKTHEEHAKLTLHIYVSCKNKWSEKIKLISECKCN